MNNEEVIQIILFSFSPYIIFFFIVFIWCLLFIKEERILRKHWKHRHTLEDLILSNRKELRYLYTIELSRYTILRQRKGNSLNVVW